MASSSDWAPPEEFDEYRIVQPLGRGGMGQVFLAYDRLLDRLVAVKFIPAVDEMPEFRERFLIEARAAARLQHPNVASVYRVGELGWRPYIISEFVPGETLDKLARPVPWKRALELGIFLARGLAAAHRHGVLHRDIKPNNAILAQDGSVKLVDFGLAKLTDEEPMRQSIPPSSHVQKLELTPAPLGSFSGVIRDPPSRPTQAPDGNATLVSIGSTPGNSGAAAGRASSRANAGLAAPAQAEVVGTPLYMAPEIWRGEPATRRSDIYSLAVVLYELCAGKPPHFDDRAKGLRRIRTEQDAPALLTVAPRVDPTFASIVDRCLRRDPAERFASADQLLESLEQLVPAAGGAAIPAGNPYRGLHSFEAEHRALFFGRSAEVRAVLEQLRAERFVLVAGDSGTGKSSLCRAGVLPLIEEGALQQGRTWSVLGLVPGAHPLACIATTLAPVLNLEDEAVAHEMVASPEIVCRSLQTTLGRNRGIVLFVDQIEELLTLSDWNEASQAAHFLARLAASVQGVRLLATVRGDFLTRLARLPGLGADLPRAMYLLRPLSPDRVREAIMGPAQATGVRFESEEMIDTLVESTARAEGALPLLQFALAELWEARDKQQQSIPASALDAIGGVEGALARHADGVLASLLPGQQVAARRILVRLVTADGTRARRTPPELSLDAAGRAALEALVRGRLIAVRQIEGGTSYEVAHEALIGGWSTLSGWLDAQAEGRAARQRLEVAAAEWRRLDRIREALWSARQLAEAESLDESELSEDEADFLRASRRAVRGARRLRNVLLAAVPVFLALVYGGIELKTKRDLENKVAVHLTEAKAALEEARSKAALVERMREEAFSLFDTRKLESAEPLWDRAAKIADETSFAYARAGQALEAVLVLDSSQKEAHELFGDILYERALLAERDHEPLQLAELLARLPLYDDDSERRSRWNAPASITVHTVPPRADVSLERYTSRDGRMVQAEAMALGRAPLVDRKLAPGSYILRFSVQDRVETRYPLYLRRGEQLSITVDLPEKSEIPRGFVYIPAGRFLFGTALDDNVRLGFLNAVPVHDVNTGPYLIAEHETTYAEWIEFLNALPPSERAQHLPRAGAPGMPESIELVEQPAGKWMLRFQPAAVGYVLLSGEKIRYLHRKRRIEQDWMQFPVSGISSADAEAYAAWLRTTGRVPGARLCTEYEWERAARGADPREYPHGDRIEPDDASYIVSHGQGLLAIGPDEVGSHPATRSPFGVDDMTGNVFELTRSSLSATDYMIRGGAYYYSGLTVSVTNREGFEPTTHHATVGVRYCATWPAR